MSKAFKDQKSFIDDIIKEEDAKDPKTHYDIIAQMLNDRNYVDRDGRPWNYSTVRVYAVNALGCTKRVHKRTKAEIAKDAEDAKQLAAEEAAQEAKFKEIRAQEEEALRQTQESLETPEIATTFAVPKDGSFSDTLKEAGSLLRQGKIEEAGVWLEASSVKENQRSERSQKYLIKYDKRLRKIEGHSDSEIHTLQPPKSPRDLLFDKAARSRLTEHIDAYCLATNIYTLDSPESIKGKARKGIRDKIREGANSIVFSDGQTYPFGGENGWEGKWNSLIRDWYGYKEIKEIHSTARWDWMAVVDDFGKMAELVDYVINVQFPIPTEGGVPVTEVPDSYLPPF